MPIDRDAQGRQLLAQLVTRGNTVEIIERDDGYIDTGSEPGTYFREYDEWWPSERDAIAFAKGRVLDIGCGAGRHSLYLQSQGFDVTGIDASRGAVRVCKDRGLKKVLCRSIDEVDRFKAGAFDTVLLMGNNFGLLGGRTRAKVILKRLHRITSDDARIIAGTRDPYRTSNPNHLHYHRWNRRRGRMGGQIRMRVRFERAIGKWFDYLFVSPQEMRAILRDTDWGVETLVSPESASYFAVLRKT